MSAPQILPTIHMNGTSRRDLVGGYVRAINALDDALVALRSMAPNGRDYYPQGPQAIGQAIEQHLARVGQVQQVRDAINADAEAIA